MEDVGNKMEEVGDRLQRMKGHRAGNVDVTQSRMDTKGLINPSLISVKSLLSSDASGTIIEQQAVGDRSKTHDLVSSSLHVPCVSDLGKSDPLCTNFDDTIRVDESPIIQAQVVSNSVSQAVKSSAPIQEDHIVKFANINTKSTSYARVEGASLKDQPKVNSVFCPLVADPVFDGVNISNPRKVVEKVSTHFDHTLYGYFIGKRMAFLVVEYYARNNWGKHRLKRIMTNNKGFFFFKFDSRTGLEAVLEGGPWMIRNSLIILKKWSMGTSLLKEELTRIPIWGRSSFSRWLIEVNSEADLVDVVTLGIPSLTGDDFTKETIRVDYEWRPPRCNICNIFGHVYVHCPKKVVSSPIVTTSNVVTHTVEKSNDGFQTVCKKKKRKGKSKSTNGGQFTGPSVKQNVRYEPKSTTSAPKKGATNLGNTSKSTSMLRTNVTSSKNDNIITSNSYSALNDKEEDEEEEEVENVYDESANLFTKTGKSSSFMVAAG
nr:zinc knuckle CX2CX4HX4C [Tanacetum cinerariifolium]